MIINIGGAFGSGKSTIVRQIISCYEIIETSYINNKKGIGYVCSSKDIEKPLRVMGLYSGPELYSGGGCDNLKFGKGSLNITYNLIKLSPYENIIYEGTIINSVPKLTELHNEGYPITVIFIELSLEDCIKSILERRERNLEKKPFNPKETIQKHTCIKNRIKKLKRLGVNVLVLNRSETFHYCCKEFGISKRVPPTLMHNFS